MNVSFERIAMSDLMDSFRLDGKVALVTGATYGIGMAGESTTPYILTKNMRPEPHPFAKSIKTKSR